MVKKLIIVLAFLPFTWVKTNAQPVEPADTLAASKWAFTIDIGKTITLLPALLLTNDSTQGSYFRQEAGITYQLAPNWYLQGMLGYTSHFNFRNYEGYFFSDLPEEELDQGPFNQSHVHTYGGYLKLGLGYLFKISKHQRIGFQLRYWHSVWNEQHVFKNDLTQQHFNSLLAFNEKYASANGTDFLAEWFVVYKPNKYSFSVSASFRKVLFMFDNMRYQQASFNQELPYRPPIVHTVNFNTQTQYIPGFGPADQYFFNQLTYHDANPKTSFDLTFPALQFYVSLYL